MRYARGMTRILFLPGAGGAPDFWQPVAALLPHALQRYAAVPMGIAMIWLGYSLWSERRRSSQGVPAAAIAVR